MLNKTFMTADDVANELGISKAFAYKVIKKFNQEMEEKGYFTMAGRVNTQYLIARTTYGFEKEVKEEN